MLGSRLFVKNLDFTANRQDVIAYFQAQGWVVKDVYVPRKTGKTGNEGYCFIEFETPREAESVLRIHNGTPGPGGRELLMSHAAPRAPKP